MMDFHHIRFLKKIGSSPTNVRYWINKLGLSNKKEQYKCECGKTGKDNFYSSRKNICKKCHNQESYQFHKSRRENNINCRIADNIRNRLRHALNGKRKVGSAIENLGCSVTELVSYLEK